MEISDISCDYLFSILNSSTFIIPKIIYSKIELKTISILDYDVNSNFLNNIIQNN